MKSIGLQITARKQPYKTIYARTFINDFTENNENNIDGTAFNLTFAPGMVGLGEPVFDAMVTAYSIEGMSEETSGAVGPVRFLDKSANWMPFLRTLQKFLREDSITTCLDDQHPTRLSRMNLQNPDRLTIYAALLCLAIFMPEAEALSPESPLPALRDGVTVTGPGIFHHEGTLRIEGSVILRDLELDIRGPIVVAPDAHLELERVHLKVGDEPNTPNGTSGLKCLGRATILIRNSSMEPVGPAHPMWSIEGHLDVDAFEALNSEFHLKRTTAKLNRLKIFELEVSQGSQVTAEDVDLVFFSSHTADDDDLKFSNIPDGKSFSRRLRLGSGAVADLKDARVQIFLIYVHGQSRVDLENMGRVQLAVFTPCRGAMVLPNGRLGKEHRPAVFPDPRLSDCPFRISLRNVNVDSWDVYASGHADLKFSDSMIDELTASSQARIEVSKSSLYADWLALSDDARLSVTDSTVGSLRLSAQRPDLATSQVRMSDRSQAAFIRDRFDCGIYVGDHAEARIIAPLVSPRYQREVGSGRVIHEPASVPRQH